MNLDDFQQAWQGQPGLVIDSDVLLQTMRRREQRFRSMLFWRDCREIGIALLMVPLWLYLGAKDALPWTWYLMVPVFLWIAGFMLVDRKRHQRSLPESAPIRQRVESSVAIIRHQIELLRNVHRWALLPMAMAMAAFFGQVAWQQRGGGWWTVLSFSMVSMFGVTVFTFIYWLNRYAVRAMLEPRRRELEQFLLSFREELPDVRS